MPQDLIPADLDALSLDSLVGLSQSLGREQDAIRAQRLIVADAIRARIAQAAAPAASPSDVVAEGALPTIAVTPEP